MVWYKRCTGKQVKDLHELVAVRCFHFLPDAAVRDKAIGTCREGQKRIYIESEYLAASFPAMTA